MCIHFTKYLSYVFESELLPTFMANQNDYLGPQVWLIELFKILNCVEQKPGLQMQLSIF